MFNGLRQMRMEKGYTLIILLFAIFIMGLGLMLAVPVLQTQIQREKEEELIFRGKQYVEAVRIFQMKYPGAFPKTLEDLQKERCIRQLYKDPMTNLGEWDLILQYTSTSPGRAGTSAHKVLIAPSNNLSSIDNPRILGVVSSSPKKSIKIYLGQQTYNKWLFYYGQDPNKMPEIIYYGEAEKK